MRQLGQILVDDGLITAQQLDEATARHQAEKISLGRVLIEAGHVTERDLVRALASQIGIPFVDLSEYEIDARAATLISDTMAKRYTALPIGFQSGKLVVAMSDPANVLALDDIRTITGEAFG